jgi:hypothetical protein
VNEEQSHAPDENARGSTPAPGADERAAREQPRRHAAPSTARAALPAVFREGAKNCARGGRAPRRHPALANENDRAVVLANAAEIDADGWGLIAPFGEWPKTRMYREHGQIKSQDYLQVLDHTAAAALTGRENSLFGRLKRAFIGIPVYLGHGDLSDVDPHAVTRPQPKLKLGVVDQVRQTPRGIEAHFALDHDGAAAVAAGWKFPSAFWYVQPTANAQSPEPKAQSPSPIRCRPFKLISVALTQFPNISGVESLANAATPALGVGTACPHILPSHSQTKDVGTSRPHPDAAHSFPLPIHFTDTNISNNTPMKELLLGWLATQGVALANDVSDTGLVQAVQAAATRGADQLTALGNEKSQLDQRLAALENEARTAAEQTAQAHTALANEQAARHAERQTAAGVVVDEAIRRGIKPVAERAAALAALANTAAFAQDAAALLALSPARATTTNGLDRSGKQQAGLSDEAQALHNEYQQAFQAELMAAGQNPAKAHANIMTLPKYGGLAAKLMPKQ